MTQAAINIPIMPRNVRRIKTADHEVFVSMRIEQPEVALLDNILTHEECDQLIALSVAKLKQSTIVDPKTGKAEVIQSRSSYGTYFMLNENAFIAKLDARIAKVMHWPVENGEGLQILNYKVGGEYTPHFDYFPPDDPGSAVHIAKGGQRVSTLILYLNEGMEGGETTFPHLGLAITPKKGSAIYFEYCDINGKIEPSTLHAGAPVTSGEKWIATKWMRQRRYG